MEMVKLKSSRNPNLIPFTIFHPLIFKKCQEAKDMDGVGGIETHMPVTFLFALMVQKYKN